MNAYCVECKENRTEELLETQRTESGKQLQIGTCSQCGTEIRRITK